MLSRGGAGPGRDPGGVDRGRCPGAGAAALSLEPAHHVPAGNVGGLLNSIEGTFVIVFGVLILAGGMGIAGGVYLAEYSREGRGHILRGGSEVLAGVPSIVLGYVGLVVLVDALHWGYSIYAGIIVVAVLVVPYVMKTTEVALRNVPTSYREGGEALGMRSGYLLRRLVMRPALPGIATGLIMAVAISLGETAPLLLTVGVQREVAHVHLSTLPGGVPDLQRLHRLQPTQQLSHQRAYTAALLLMLLVLLLIVVARIIVMMTQRNSPDRTQRVGKAGK